MLAIDPITILDPAWQTYTTGVRALLRPLTADKMRELTAQARKETVGQAVTNPNAFKEVLDRMTQLYVIEDWEGIVDTKGEKLPVTEENILLVTRVLPRFGKWALLAADRLTENIARERAARLKNLKTSQDTSADAQPA